jgi:hypothetical protein
MLDSRRTRIADTVSWFPDHIPMPLASSTDLILAGITDILAALKNPTPENSLAPLSPSAHDALIQLTALLTNQPATETGQQPATAPPLLAPTVAPPRRVTFAPNTRTGPSNNDQRAAPLRVTDTPFPITKETHHITIDEPTYANSTGLKGRLRRRANRKPTNSKKIHSNKRPSPATIRHNHATRSGGHSHAALTTLPSDSTPALPIHYYALHGNAFNPDTGKIAEYPELSQCSQGHLWQESNAEEIGRLAQGYKTTQGTNTIFFIHKSAVPRGKIPTYLRIVAAYRPEKDNPQRIRWTAGGDRVDYPGETATKTADLTTVKCLINSTVSTPEAKMMTGDLKDFYLGTPMPNYEYMKIATKFIPDHIMDAYDLWDKVSDGFVYVEIRRGMYGLPQAGRLANDALVLFLADHGYAPVPVTAGLWSHKTRDITFSLVVDDFGIKYTKRADVDHLLTCLKLKYVVKEDWTAERYCGLTLKWDYTKRTCEISMPGYIERVLQRFAHSPPARPERSPHRWLRPEYGASVQYAPPDDDTCPLPQSGIKRIQEVIGCLQYYARAVDGTMLAALGTISSQQTTATTKTMTAVIQLLNYAATNPDATIRYHASDMILHVDSDASYLSESKARSRVAGYHFLSSHPKPNPRPTDPLPPHNAPVYIHCQILREVVSSAAEAELGACFHNGKEATSIRQILIELGHPQPATPIVTDNSTAVGIANDTVKQKRSKAVDMRFYWIRDRVRQNQFEILWRPGILNKADYFTKHHPASHHKAIRSAYLFDPKTTQSKNYFECLSDEYITKKSTTAAAHCATILFPPDVPSHVRKCATDSGEGVLFSRNSGNRYPTGNLTVHPLNDIPVTSDTHALARTRQRTTSSLIH